MNDTKIEITHTIIQAVVGLFVLGCAFFFLYLIFFSGNKVPTDLHDPLSQTIGGVLSIIGTIVGFYFGLGLGQRLGALKAAATSPLSPQPKLDEVKTNA